MCDKFLQRAKEVVILHNIILKEKMIWSIFHLTLATLIESQYDYFIFIVL